MYHLTTQQQNIWSLQSFYENTTISNISGIVKFHTHLDIERLKKAVNMYVKYQEGARLKFVKKGSLIQQYIEPYLPFDIPVENFENISQAEEFARKEAKLPYNFRKSGEPSGKMYHFTIYETKDACGIMIHMNHLISDAWTLSLCAGKIIEYYQLLEKENTEEIPVLSYIEYIKKEQSYLTSDKYKKDAEYWENRFRETPVRKRIKPEEKEETGIASRRITKKLSQELSANIRDFCKKSGYSPAIIFESVIFTYLDCINESGKETIIGVPVLNRTGKEKQIAGMFISTMPLGITIEPGDTMSAVCQKVSASHYDLFRHQRFPYSRILQQVRQKHKFEGNLYDVLVSYQNAVVGKTEEIEYETEWICNGYSEVSMAFHIDDRDESGCFTINMDVQSGLFAENEAKMLLNRILNMVDIMVCHTETAVNKIPLMPEEEYEMVVHRFNDTAVKYSLEKCVHELFEKQVEKQPDSIAVVFEGKDYTYRQINEMSNSLAFELRQKGITRNTVVPIVAHRSYLVIVAMLGILKAGGAYMPVAPEAPKERKEYMFTLAECKMVLILGAKKESLPFGYQYVDLAEFDYECSKEKVENKNEAEDLCYVIFTSGSTGKPKGVSISHKCMINYVEKCRSSGFGKDNRLLAHTIFNFDISVYEVLSALLCGAYFYYANDKEMNHAELLAYAIEKFNLNTICTTPTKYKIFLRNTKFAKAFKKIKYISVGGETVSKSFIEELKLYTSAPIYIEYGPTETTIYSTQKKIERYNKSGPDITIGSPVANTQIYILNKDGRICPVGVAGELCIAGDGVGKGYLNQPELTMEKFVLNPFATEKNGHGKVIYHTGDLARWRIDGEIDFLGRIDTQIKIRGLRIELGEIESVFSAYPGVGFCAVTDKRDKNGRQFLAGYYTGQNELNIKEIRGYLEAKLPAYMIPNYFVHLEKIPMTSSGKTDRKKLPMPDLSNQTAEYVPPKTETEKLVCRLYQKVLSVEKAGITDNFFELGGDSLAAMSLVSNLSDIYSEVSLQWIFEKPVVKDLSEWLETREEINKEDKNNIKKQTFFTENNKDRYQKYHEFLKQRKQEQEIRIENIEIKKILNHISNKSNKRGIILTGATGFLGAHILKNLLDEYAEDTDLICLVRGETAIDAVKRLYQVMEDYFGKDTADLIDEEKNVYVIACDIADNPFVHIRQYLNKHPVRVTQIFHTAALVKHYGRYEEFYHTNVEGTKNMIAAAKELQAEFLHISTESVGGLYVEEENYASEENLKITDNIRRFTEQDFYIGQNLDNVYIRSKFEAECCVFDYLMEGGRAKIFRVGNLSNRYTDGKFQKNYKENSFLRRMYTFLLLGVYPDILSEYPFEFSPVDETAKAVLVLAKQDISKSGQFVYHVSHNSLLSYSHFANLTACFGMPLRTVSVDVFFQTLQLGNVSHDYVRNFLLEIKKTSGRLLVLPDNKSTTACLEKSGFVWSVIDKKYVKQYLAYIRGLEI